MPYTILGYWRSKRYVLGVRNEPPTTASLGAAYIIGPSPAGAWAGADNVGRIAMMGGAGWRFLCPDVGLRVYNAETQKYIYNSGRGWLDYPPNNITVGDTPPANPQAGDLWVDTTQ